MSSMKLERILRRATLLAVVLQCCALPGSDWPRFRGPSGTGVADEKGLPTKWSEEEGLAWKTEMPGPGSSSPVVSAGRVYLTAYSGYGVNRAERGDLEKLRRHVVSVDARSGKLLWSTTIETKLPEAAFEGIGIPNHGYASSTPAVDSERVYAFFGRNGVVALDLEGKEAWRAPVGPDARTHMFGTASSPILYKGLVIVPAGIECESILAFDRRTGAEVWRAPAKGYGTMWGTPILVDAAGDRKDLLINVPEELWAINPDNGKLRWYAQSIAEDNISPSVVAANGVAYAIGGRRGGSVAIRFGGRGDVTKTNVLWKQSTGAYIGSPVLHEGHLYWVNDRGVAYCVKADTGEKVYEERLADAGAIYASPIVADGKLYVVTRRNGTLVLDAKPKLSQISRNTIPSDETDFNASPAVSDGRLYLRSNKALYCVGGK